MMLEDGENGWQLSCETAKNGQGHRVDCIRSLRWVKLADKAERSLHWLIPAATLAYFVFRILPSLGF
jgi:hypothetical protein